MVSGGGAAGSVGGSVVRLDPVLGATEVFATSEIDPTAIGAFADGTLLLGYQEIGSSTRTLALLNFDTNQLENIFTTSP